MTRSHRLPIPDCCTHRERAGPDDDRLYARTASVVYARRAGERKSLFQAAGSPSGFCCACYPIRILRRCGAQLEEAFGRTARITDYTETNPQLNSFFRSRHPFPLLVSLIALIVAGLGVGATMQSHVRQKMPNIAFMKCIGGRSAQVIRIYVVQAAMIGIIGSTVGALLGAFAQAAFARLVANYFDIAVILIWPWSAMFKGVAAAMCTAILFALPALL